MKQSKNDPYFKLIIGHSDDEDSLDAIDEVINQCKEKLDGSIPMVGLLFTSIEYDHDIILKRIEESFQNLPHIGCTSNGEMSSELGFCEESITLAIFSSNCAKIVTGIVDNISENDEDKLIKQLDLVKTELGDDPKLCFITPSSLTASGVVLLKNMRKALGNEFPVFGGTAGDNFKFQTTYQFYNGKRYKDAMPFIFFGGKFIHSFGIESGWKSNGEKEKVVKSEDNTVFRIGDKTAYEYYQHYLGEDISIAGEYPLAVYEDGDTEPYLRAALQTDREKGTITFAGDVPENTLVRLTDTSRDEIINASKKSILNSFESYEGNKPSIALCISCAARKLLLGSRTQEEYELLSTVISDEIQMVGFYGYGEISPLKKDNLSRFHNQTFVSLLLGIE